LGKSGLPAPPEAAVDPLAATAAGGREEGELLARVRHIARENERLVVELLGAEQRYRGLARAVWQVQEEERRRLARELHDGLGQTLTALKNHLERLAGRPGRGDGDGRGLGRELASAVEMAAAALADAREMSRLLRPPVLDDLGLVPALRWLARTLEERTGLVVEVTGAEERDERLPPELETLVFRAVQESLTNALKHSGARAAEVELDLPGPVVRVRVADAGAGFDPDATLQGPATGAGLTGMRDRVGLFGGRLTVSSRPGRGTEVLLEVPRDGAGPERLRPA
jgi:signal transduction histidine kinase